MEAGEGNVLVMLTPFSADVKDPPFREIIRNLSSSLRESF
jgi:hypothetical protein